MITKLTQQLYKSSFLLSFLLVFTLLGFFFYAFVLRAVFFLYLIGALICALIYLLVHRVRLTEKLAGLSLQKQGFLEKANMTRAEIQKEINAIESIHEKIVRYSHLKDLTEKLCMSFSVQESAQVVTREVGHLFGRDDLTSILYFFHAKSGKLSLAAAVKGAAAVELYAKKGDIYDHWVVRNLKPLLIKDTHSDFRFDMEKIGADEARDFRSLMSVPMLLEDRVIGILRLDSPKVNYFDTEDVRLLLTVGHVGAIAVENAQLYERIEELAIRDSLTGLYLRRHLLDRLSLEIKRELRRKKELAFLMVDLDHFKKYNDKYGHTAGDIVLKVVAQVLGEIFETPGNIVCRYGGEEFAVLIPDCPKKEAVRLAEALRRKVKEQTIVLRRKKTGITVSVGVAVFPADAQIKEELIQRADQAMYQAKKNGRNRVCVAAP